MSRDPLPPTRAVLRWVEESVGSGARVVAVRRVTGGVANHTHDVAVETSAGGRSFILRRPDDRASPRADTIAREVDTLSHLATHATALPVPELVAHTPDVDGRAALLMTKLLGAVDLAPPSRDAWLQQQAETLAVIHAIP